MLVGLKKLPVVFFRWLLMIAIVLAFGAILAPLSAAAQELDRSTFVVSLEKLDGSPYARAVMIAVPYANGHLGVVLNKPWRLTLRQVFPDHAPSVKLDAPIYLGGGDQPMRIVAMVKSKAAPDPRAVHLLPEIWLVGYAPTIDDIIEKRPQDARFYLGLVWWPHGELAREVREGEVVLRAPNAAQLFLPDTYGLYDQLARRNKLET